MVEFPALDWRERVAAAKASIARSLHLYSPLVAVIFREWKQAFGGGSAFQLSQLPLSDTASIQAGCYPLSLAAFQQTCVDSVQQNKQRFLAEWHLHVTSLVKTHLSTFPTSPEDTAALLACVDAVMLAQSHGVVLGSLQAVLACFLRFAVRRQRNALREVVGSSRRRIREANDEAKRVKAAAEAEELAAQQRQAEAEAARVRVALPTSFLLRTSDVLALFVSPLESRSVPSCVCRSVGRP